MMSSLKRLVIPLIVAQARLLGDWREFSIVGLLALLLLPASAAAFPEDWKLDVVHHRNGNTFGGLIVQETKEGMAFKLVLRKPGARTVVVDLFFGKEEIARVERLTEAERRELAERVAALDRGGEKERQRIKDLKLEEIRWPTNEAARQFRGKFFVLESNAREDIVRQAAVRLEDMFLAYSDRFGARREPARPITIVLCRSLTEYQQRLSGAGLNILNPAYYDPQKNLILAASDMEQRAEEYERLRHKHDGLLAELDAQEKKLRRHFNGQPPRAMIDQLWQTRRAIQMLNAENQSTLERLGRPLFTILAHEAFHAYVDSFVYPASEGGLPHWLNEGLAQVYESAVVDGGQLNVGRVDLKRLVAMQDAIRQKQALALSDIIAAEPRQFQLVHAREAQAADQLFVASWALAYYLAFHRKALAGAELETWLASLKRGTPPLEAFRVWVGQPLNEFEAEFHRYVMHLRPDGTLRTDEGR